MMGDHSCGLGNHGSCFGEEEEAMLKLEIVETEDPSKIFTSFVDFIVPEYLKHLELDKFGISEIMTFMPSDHPEVSKPQRLFLRRLQDVLYCRLLGPERVDLYAKDLADTVMRECRLDDGTELYMRYSKLSLRIGSKKHDLFSDREGSKSGEIVWVLQESKHKQDNRYKGGDVDLAAAMIAACQSNFTNRRGILRRKVLFGIKVVGEEFFFYRIEFHEAYVKEIAEAVPMENCLRVYKYPPLPHGLRISKPEERKKLLCLMHKLREYCLCSTLM